MNHYKSVPVNNIILPLLFGKQNSSEHKNALTAYFEIIILEVIKKLKLIFGVSGWISVLFVCGLLAYGFLGRW